jgi:hypothetical protein
MVEFKNVVIGALLVAIFAYALIGFSVQMAVDNNVNNSIMNNEVINSTYSNLETQIDDLKHSAETQKDSWYADIPVLGDATIIFQSIAGITRTFFSGFVSIYNLLIGLISKTIGFPIIILNGIVGVIIIISLLLLWSLYKAGT